MRQHRVIDIKMTAFIPYLRTRDGVFQYERRVPLGVQRNRALFEARFGGRPLFRCSLRSKDRLIALRAYEAADRKFQQLVSLGELGAHSTIRQCPPAERIVTDADLVAISDRYEHVTAEPFERLHRRANVCGGAADELDRMEYELGQDAPVIRAFLQGRDVSDGPILHLATEAQSVITEYGFDAPHMSEQRGAVIGAVRNGLERGYKRITALAEGTALPTLGSTTKAGVKAQALTLADAVEVYLKARRLPVKSESETRLSLRQCEQIIGCKTLSAITRHDAHRFAEYLAGQKVGGRTTGSILRHLSEASIRKRLRMIISAINHVRDAGLFDGENVFSGIRVENIVSPVDKSVMPDKRRFQVSELNCILEHPWFVGCKSPTDIYTVGPHRLDGSHYWVPIVALLTGCRASELGGLKVSEIRDDDANPHIIIRNNEYRRTKSGRNRCVPILDALVELGFLSYVERIRTKGHDRLFPDWTANKRKGNGENNYPAWSNSSIIRAFNRNIIPATMGERLAPDARREVTFHSFRGAFKAMLSVTNRVPPIIVNEVVGHANGELDERYVGEVSIEETYPLVRFARYKGLIIPPPPPLRL